MFGFGRKKKDVAPKTATNRGRGAGRTRGTRADDLADAKDKRKPRGVTSPIRNAAKAGNPPTSRVKPLSADKQNITNTVTKPNASPTVKPAKVSKTPLTKKPQVTGLDGRNVTSDGPSGKRKRANVTREQMERVGLDPKKKSDLTKYLNKFDKLKRRPRKSDFSTLLSPVPVISEVKNRVSEARNPMSKRESKFNRGGMAMKTKMGTKGGAMGGAKGYKDGGKLPMVKDPKTGNMIPAYAADGKGKMMAGGPVKKMKSKGMAKGGMMKTKGGAMKTKGYKKGGKVRGAGIARKGVRPAKML